MKGRTKFALSIVAGIAAGTAWMATSAISEVPTKGYNTEIPGSIMTPNRLNTPLGAFDFYDGVPTKKTAVHVYEKLDFLRATDVFLDFLPAVSIEALRRGQASIGADASNKVIVFDQLMDSNQLFLTGNTDTVYALAMLDLEKDGPTVVEIPRGAGPGTLDDAFQRFIVDMGAPGPDRGRGGLYLILPPDYQDDLKPTPNTIEDPRTVQVKIAGKTRDVWVAQSPSYVNWLILRGFLVNGKPDAASKMWRTGLKVYPLAEAADPPKMEFINGSKKSFNTILPTDITYFQYLWHVLQKEPIDFIDPELRGMAGAIGIVKGKPFKPDQRMKEILSQAVSFGNAAARTLSFRPRDERARIFPDRQWYAGFVGKDYRWLDGDGRRGRNLDARIAFFYMAIVNTPAMALEIPGVGSNYGMEYTDKDGNILKGDRTYKLHLPPNVPAKDFWSIVLYDPETRSQLQTSQPFPSRNSKRNKLIYNKDGSIDLYFGPKPPRGKKANWIGTVPGKSWFAVLRLYGPLESWFRKAWKPGDIELLQ